jgi:hypothetical protein
MSRIIEEKSSKGSQRWLQHYVNENPDALDAAIGLGHIT